VVAPQAFAGQTEDKLNQLVLTPVGENGTADYWAGFCWDKAGLITSADAWKQHVDEFAQGLTAPIKVSVKAQ
jgi:hypothetical protein